MITVARAYLNWTEEEFWGSTLRKFMAMKEDYFKMENRKLKAINPNLELNEEDSQPQGVYIDQIGI